MQAWIVGLIVTGCTVYAVWALLPMSWRRRAANSLADGPWPHALQRALRRAGESGGCGGGGCKGCSAGDKAPGAVEQPVRFHPRSPTR